jgi:predicted anti-sigma-YlaC factor YlaD
MRCSSSRRFLSRYLDGELGRWRRRRLDHHLAGCRACRAQLDADRRVWMLLDAAETPEPPDLLARLEARLTRADRAPARRRWCAPVAYAAALLAFAGGGAAGGVYAAERRPPPNGAGESEYAEFLGEMPPGLAPVSSLLQDRRSR